MELDFEPLAVAIADRVAELLDKPTQTVRPRWVGYKECAAYLDLTETALRQRVAGGQVPPQCLTKLAGSVRFDLEEIDKWMLRNKEL